jgi:hypothetical protein
MRPYLKNTHPPPKKELVEWLKVKAMSSRPSTAKTTKIAKVEMYMVTIAIVQRDLF